MLLEHEGVLSLASADGTDAHALVNGADPVWAPDGTRFAFAHGHDAEANPLYAVAHLDGTTLLTDIVGATPTWSPDGTRLALEVYRPEGPMVQVIEVASGNVLWEREGMHPARRP